MAQIPVVYGEWKIEENSWHFVVDMGKGERMWFLNDGCTLGELTEMARVDYNLGKKIELIELTYSLPVSMLQTMAPYTPPMHVTNDKQVSSLIALSRVHMVRLCVSSRVEMDTEENQEGSNEDLGEESEENSEHSTDDEADSSDVNEDGEDVDDAAYSDGEDYSVYGKVKDEDDDEDEVCIENVKNRYSETGSTPMSWRSCYQRLDLLKFAFKIEKSTKTLFVAKCRVEGCAWMVRASVKNDASTFWVKKYVKDHTCSIALRMAQRGKSTPKYIGKLFISHLGIIDGLTPEHVRVSMKHMFGIKMDYTTSYRSLIYAQQLVRGTAEDGYASLPAYLHSVNKANPGTVSALHVDSNNKFKYLFLAFGASIAGFQYMRRVIVVGGCHLTGKYKDGNFQIFPLAFGIVDGKDDASWEWRIIVSFQTLEDVEPDKLQFSPFRHSVDILLKITSRSYAALCKARVFSKHLNEISNEEGFLRAVDLITLTIPWLWDQHGRVNAFFRRCLECKNPTAQPTRPFSNLL
ncbi:hypothetical protein EUTSA_v10023077mg [Eutrema salsugineum]|uniref:Transposase MuDR plant domain-containing protein n=1 Tax=Eutrema salsugineum TaxID=72664 RepID=V4M7U9_EUTSA|nr:hypothetical protein EUTSA_v10023077mg [Eutrema salsugineum]